MRPRDKCLESVAGQATSLQHFPAAVDHEGQCSPQTLGSSFLPRTLLPGQPDVAETRDSKEAPGGQTRISLCREPTPGQPSGRVFL